MRTFYLLLLIFSVNSVVVDSITTDVAIASGKAYETNAIAAFLIKDSVLALVAGKLLVTAIVVALALWIYRKDKELATKAVLVATAFSCGVAFNNVLVIVGGLT